MRIWVLIIIMGLIGLFLGYILSYPCQNFPQIGLFKYLYNLKCQSTKPAPNNYGQLPQINPTNNQSGAKEIQPINNLNSLSRPESGIIYENEIWDYFVNQDNEVIIISRSGEIIKSINNKSEVINAVNEPIKEVFFEGDGSRVFLGFGAGGGSVFDLKNQTWLQIPEYGFGGTISPKNELVYFKNESGVNSIFKLDLNQDNPSAIRIIKTNILDAYLSWKDNEEVFVISKPSSLAIGMLLVLNSKNKNLFLAKELPGLNFVWDTKTQHGLLLRSGPLGRGGQFFLVDKNLNVTQMSFLTIPNKCAFKNEVGQTTNQFFLICAVPKNQQELQQKTIIDDWLSYDLYTEDDIYKIDLGLGSIKKIELGGGFDIDKIKVFNNRVFFVNRFDKKLYFLKLED